MSKETVSLDSNPVGSVRFLGEYYDTGELSDGAISFASDFGLFDELVKKNEEIINGFIRQLEDELMHVNARIVKLVAKYPIEDVFDPNNAEYITEIDKVDGLKYKSLMLARSIYTLDRDIAIFKNKMGALNVEQYRCEFELLNETDDYSHDGDGECEAETNK